MAHGEGKFSFPYEKEYHIALKYNYEGYPWPTRTVHPGRLPVSALTTDAILAMMPHLERAMLLMAMRLLS